MTTRRVRPLIVVGPCAAGKSTLVAGLARQGIRARAVAQEHSHVADLYRHQGEGPVVFLAASWPIVHSRRPHSFGRPQYEEQWGRLGHARAEAALILHTDALSVDEVRDRVAAWWKQCQSSWR